jgi:Thioesterase superfamily
VTFPYYKGKFSLKSIDILYSSKRRLASSSCPSLIGTRIQDRELLNPIGDNTSREAACRCCGAQVMRWMEMAAYIAASRVGRGGRHLLTASMDSIAFRHPTRVGDILYVSAQVPEAAHICPPCADAAGRGCDTWSYASLEVEVAVIAPHTAV